MNKEDFLFSLEKRLKRLKKADRKRFLDYYGEIVEDYMEDGCTETEAVSRIGNVDDIAKEILSDQEVLRTPASKVLTTVLLILGSPLWASLLLAVLCLLLGCGLIAASFVLVGVLLILCVYLIIWCIPLITGSMSIASLILAVVSLMGAIPVGLSVSALGVVQFGVGIGMVGIFILFTLISWLLVKVFAGTTVRFTRWLSRLFGRLFHKKRGVTA